MRCLFLLLFFGLKLLPSTSFGKAIVGGVFRNALYGRRVEVLVNHRFIDGKTSSFSASLNESGSFSLDVQVPEPQLVTLTYDDDKLVFFIEPTDTVFIETDAMQFPLVVEFGGRGAYNNRLLRQYLLENPTDFNEFSLLRYRSGNLWLSMTADMDVRMQALAPAEFKDYLDKKKQLALLLLDEFTAKHSLVSQPFRDFLSAEILYSWAYNLLFYGSIYKNWHHVEPAFFEFMWEVPSSTEVIGSHTYRQYVIAVMNWLQLKDDPSTKNAFVSQYQHATDRLSGKPLAFFRSEIIHNALKANYLNEILSSYTEFLKANPFHEYDSKITEVFEREARYAPGILAPNFSGKDRNGVDFSLEKLRGKVVLLDFWASWCRPCLQKMDEMQTFRSDLETAGVQVVHISLDTDQFDWQKTVAERGIWGSHLLSASPDSPGNIAASYDVKAIPQYFIIGKDGRFAEKPHSTRLDDLKMKLLQLASQNN